MKKYNKIVYLDYAATTPVDPIVFKAMAPYFSQKFGNTMSLHSLGQEAKTALEQSRQTVAGLILAKSEEIFFTSSATESNNLVIKGVALANRAKGKHIIISSIEHPCIMESAAFLEKHAGFKITRLPVDKFGFVSPESVRKAITPETILVSIIHGSNEIGTIQPIAKIGKICKEKGVYFHTDASQSLGKIPINVNQMNIDLLTGSSHKMYGPKGAALLYVASGVKVQPILHGGGHEQGLRSSTVNIPAIVGFAKACELCQKQMKQESFRLAKIRNKIVSQVLKTIPYSYLNGHPKNRLPNNINFRFSFIEGEALVLSLDLEGICVSTGSACSSAKLQASHVLLALGLKPQEAHGSLRVSLGRFTTQAEVDYFLKTLPKVIESLRRISPFKK